MQQSPADEIPTNVSAPSFGAVNNYPSGSIQFKPVEFQDAVAYIQQVRLKLNHQPQIYNDFLDTLKAFESQIIDGNDVIARVNNLFQGHPELIAGFNMMLGLDNNNNGSCEGSESIQNNEDVTFEEALSYMRQIKLKFSDQPQVYKEFVKTLRGFQLQTIDTPGVISSVCHLFERHPELIVGFNRYFPMGLETSGQVSDSSNKQPSEFQK